MNPADYFTPEILEYVLKGGAAAVPFVLLLGRFAYRVGYRAAVASLKKQAASDGKTDFLDYLAAELPSEPPALFGASDGKKPPR